MTLQSPEQLIHRNLAYDMYTLPLRKYLRDLRKWQRPSFSVTCTSCWRGYQGVWEIYRNKLWLVDLRSPDWPMKREIEESAAEAFPHAKLPLHARWFSGELVCSEGACISASWAGFGMSIFERDRLIGVRHGEVENEMLRINPPNPVCYRIKPDGSREFADKINGSDHLQNDLYEPHETPHGLRFWIAEGEDLLKADLTHESPQPARSYFAEPASAPSPQP